MTAQQPLQHTAVQEELQAMIGELLGLKSEYLQKFWGIGIRDGAVHQLPQLIAGYCPDLDALPEFLIALAVEVEWTEEAARIHDIPQVPQPCAVTISLYQWVVAQGNQCIHESINQCMNR
jgi:hypothetical protein